MQDYIYCTENICDSQIGGNLTISDSNRTFSSKPKMFRTLLGVILKLVRIRAINGIQCLQ